MLQEGLRTSDLRGLANYMMISDDMERFALTTTGNEVIATSEELAETYRKHFTSTGKAV